MSKATDKDLRCWFLDYRRRFFPDLPLSIDVRFAVCYDPDTKERLDGRWIAPATIKIDPNLAGHWKCTRVVLLHEMIHATGILGHGPRFEAAKNKLFRRGAYRKLL